MGPFDRHHRIRELDKNEKEYRLNITYFVFNVYLDKLSNNIMLFYFIFKINQIILRYNINYLQINKIILRIKLCIIF